VLCDPQPRFDVTHRLRQLSEYNSRYRLPVARQEIGHCGRSFNGMTAAGEDPIAVIQWPVEFVDREWQLSGKSNVH
jgi:hypothetical protein